MQFGKTLFSNGHPVFQREVGLRDTVWQRWQIILNQKHLNLNRSLAGYYHCYLAINKGAKDMRQTATVTIQLITKQQNESHKTNISLKHESISDLV